MSPRLNQNNLQSAKSKKKHSYSKKLHHCKTIAISKSNGGFSNKSRKRLIGVKEDIDRFMFLLSEMLLLR